MRNVVPNPKAAIRTRIHEALKSLSPEQRAADSARTCALLKQQPLWREAKSVLFYVPLRDELDLMPLLREGISEGKTVSLPRFFPEANGYRACQLSLADELLAGKFGIPEPGPGSPMLPLNQLDLLLVPGVAFDLNGRRLGRGKGFYDRLLAHASGIKCGVAFDEQVQPEIPFEPHDINLNCILTPTRWLILDSARL